MPLEPSVSEQSDQELNRRGGITRRDFLRKGIWIGVGTIALGGYSSLIEPHRVVTKSFDVPISNLPEALVGLRIAQISDIHFGDYLGASHVENIVRITNDRHPDLVVATGDFVTSGGGSKTRHGANAAVPCAKVLSALRSTFGTVAVLGNHDVGSDPAFITNVLRASGIQVLRNASLPLERGGARLWLVGIDDVLGHGANVDVAFRGVPKNETVVTLVHEPDFADVICKQKVDLQLSGHSHGGQVRIPLLGAPVLPKMARKYPLGMYRVNGMHLYTNPGIGVIELPIRFDCPPEITVFTLRRA
jgi:predicted MPP superfamily phosphohydrolase